MSSEVTQRNEWDMDLSGISGSLMLLMGLALMAVVASTLPATQQIAQELQTLSYRGKLDSPEHTSTETLSWIDLIHDYPYIPWISAYFINDGPDAVEIAVNYPNDRFILNPMETITVSRPGAEERIAIIFFKCAQGETARVRITGEY